MLAMTSTAATTKDPASATIAAGAPSQAISTPATAAPIAMENLVMDSNTAITRGNGTPAAAARGGTSTFLALSANPRRPPATATSVRSTARPLEYAVAT